MQLEELKHWIIATGLDTVTLLFVLAAALLIVSALGVMFATRARRRQERQKADGPTAPGNAREIGIARWIEEGRQLFGLWQQQVERLTELEGRLAATALVIDQLRAQVIHLGQEREAASLERDHLRSIVGRIAELIQRASEAGLGAAPSGRATWYPPRPMAAASARITEKLWHRTLTSEDPVTFWSRNGSGLQCDGCDAVISANESEHEVEMSEGRTLRFHVACSGLWRVLKQALPRPRSAG